MTDYSVSPPALVGCRAKIERANQHINDLKEALKVFGDSNAQKVVSKYDDKTGILTVLFADSKELPLDISITIGEALYQLRSALDHLVWKLIAHAGNAPPIKSGFPIFHDPNGYKSRKQSMIKGISAAAEARIDALQPFNRGAAYQSDPLWILTVGRSVVTSWGTEMSIEQARAFLEDWLMHNIHIAIHPENSVAAKHLAMRCIETAKAQGLSKADLEAAAGEDLVTCVMDAQDATADAKIGDLIEDAD